MFSWGFGRIVAMIGLLALGGCVEFQPGIYSPTRISQSSLKGAEAGSVLADFLPGTDIRMLSKTAWTALNRPEGAEEVAWSNYSTGTSGTVHPGPAYLVGFNAGEEINAPLTLDIRAYLDPAAGNFTAIKNANVRLSPSVEGVKVAMLEIGDGVQVVAQESQANWYLIAQNQRVIGYVFGPLLSRLEGGDLLLAGGDALMPRICREMSYSLTLPNGDTDAWVNGACRSADESWHVVGGQPIDPG